MAQTSSTKPSSNENPPERRTYQGSCHCGAVRYEVDLVLDGVISCNCSICGRTGALLAFTSPEHFRLQSGDDNLSDYQFNHKVIHHLFCKTCGIRSFSHGVDPSGSKMIAINARCLADVDPASLKIQHFDGKHM